MSKEQREALDRKLRTPRPTGKRSIEEMRAGFAAMMKTMREADVRKSETTLGGLRALLVEPKETAAPGTILYFHGGSYLVGSPETAMSLTSALVVRTKRRALSVDYRLAPEHPLPAAFEDGVIAYRALLDQGVDARSIVLAGDSAGGGLSVGMCLLLRDANLPMPAAVVTFSAGLDMTHTGRSMESKRGIDPFFTREQLEEHVVMRLGTQARDQPVYSPALNGHLKAFPPTLLQAGSNEILLDDSTRFAARAIDAGVDVTLDVTADAPHVFQSFTGVLDEADQALDRAALFITQRLG